MAVTVEMQDTGDPGIRAEVVAAIEHVLSDRLGDWRVSIVGSQANDRWEMRLMGRTVLRDLTLWREVLGNTGRR